MWVVQVVAPAVEVPVLVGVVARTVVLLLVALKLSAQGYVVHHSRDIDVGQPVGKLIHVDVVVGNRVVHHSLPLYSRLSSPKRESEVCGHKVAIIAIVSNGQKDSGRKLRPGAGNSLLKGV